METTANREGTEMATAKTASLTSYYDRIQKHLDQANHLLNELADQGPYSGYYTDDTPATIDALQATIAELAAIHAPACNNPANRIGAADITSEAFGIVATLYYDDGHTSDFVKATARQAYRELANTYHLDHTQIQDLTR